MALFVPRYWAERVSEIIQGLCVGDVAGACGAICDKFCDTAVGSGGERKRNRLSERARLVHIRFAHRDLLI